MKKIAGLAIILAVLILGGYYGMGALTEHSIRKTIKVIDQSNGLYADIEQYHRGLFTSKANIKWRLHIPERIVKNVNGQSQTFPAQDYTTEVPLVIHHGPIIVANGRIRFGLGYTEVIFPFPAQYNDQFNAQFTNNSVKPRLNLSIFVSYLNESTVDFSVPSFKLIAKDGTGSLEWLGMDSSTTMTSGVKKVKGNVVLNGLNAAKDDAKITLSNVSSDYDLHETPVGLYLGDANFNLPIFDVFVKDQKMFGINGLVIKSDSDIEQHLFNTHFNIDLGSMLANGQSYGPGDVEVALRNLDADVLVKINEQTQAMQNGDDTQRQQAMLALLPELPKLLSKGAELEISKFSLKLPQGQIEGNLYITLPQNEQANPFELMQKIQGKTKLQIPVEAVKSIMRQSVIQQIAKEPELQQALIQQLQAGQTNQSPLSVEQLADMQAQKQLSGLEQSGFIVVQGMNYMIELSLDQGKFTINGKPYDPSTMKF